MTDPQVAMLMMGSFVGSILLGFPICFTLIAMAVAIWRQTKRPARELLTADYQSDFAGVRGFFRKLDRKKYKMHVRVFLARYRGYETCPACRGARLRAGAPRRSRGPPSGSRTGIRRPGPRWWRACARPSSRGGRCRCGAWRARGSLRGRRRSRIRAAHGARGFRDP